MIAPPVWSERTPSTVPAKSYSLVGVVDVTDYVGVYALVNPRADFMNLAFSTNPTIPAPDQGVGAAARWPLADHFYVLVGLADANGDPGDPWDSVDAFFDDGEALKHVEMGWYDTWETRIENNVHLTLWRVDERSEAGIADGSGAAFSYSRKFAERWRPFLRIGYGDGSGALLERSINAGVGSYTADGPGRVRTRFEPGPAEWSAVRRGCARSVLPAAARRTPGDHAGYPVDKGPRVEPLGGLCLGGGAARVSGFLN